MDYHLNKIVEEVEEIITDRQFVQFIKRYKREVFDALFHFFATPTYASLDSLSDVTRWCLPSDSRGRIVPLMMNDLLVSMEALDLEREAYFS